MDLSGKNLRAVSFPVGGIGAGCIGVAGNGDLAEWEVFNRPAKGARNGMSHFAVRAETGARVENCAIAGVRHDNGDDTFSVRAWNGDASCFVNCATDTAEPINESCIKVTTAAFKDFANADYRAAGASSPLVNAGVNNELAEGTDFTCRFRKIGPRMDIGCYEHQANAMVITVR